jgi:hypothetical protein
LNVFKNKIIWPGYVAKSLDGVYAYLVAIAELEFFKIVYPSGAPILPDLGRYQALAVNSYGCALDAPAERDFAGSTCLSPVNWALARFR